CENAPGSPFTLSPILGIKTDTGRYTVDGRVFRIFDGDKAEEREISEDERSEIYKKYFGLDFI
ncbi:MAG: arylamine N-acetyltransferase, partial [Clostridiales bacterium]|nr:arylamine N-acetyltransferase [Clostridiales bacterium]